MGVQGLLLALGERGTLLDPDATTWLQEDDDALAQAEARLTATDDLPMVLTREQLEALLHDPRPAYDGRADDPSSPSAAPTFTPTAEAAGADHLDAEGDADATTDATTDAGDDVAPGTENDAQTHNDATTESDDDADAAEAERVAAEAAAVTAPSSKRSFPPPADIAADEPHPHLTSRGAPLTPPPPAPPAVKDIEVVAAVEPPDAGAPGTTDGPGFTPAPYHHEYDILLDITGKSQCEGAIGDFVRYFKDRLSKGRKLLRQRRDMVGAIPVSKVRPGAYAEVKLVGLVTEVRKTKNGHRLIELEDETGVAVILAPKGEPHLIQEADTVIEDEVLGVVAKPARSGDLLILQEIVRPDVPMDRTVNKSPRHSFVAFVSDVHIGSKTFLEEDWARFERWITLNDPDKGRLAEAKQTKYLVVNGDVVDGVGMFPGQEDELAIVDAYEQYAAAGESFHRIQAARPDLKIFMLPGNHDLVRPAEPQPAFPEKYARLFPEELVQVGNPGKLLLEGVEVLAYHGRSFDDWIMRVQGLSYDRPIEVMRQMVQRRHLVPVYGLRTPLAPEHEDFLVVDTVPDVFVTGHVHSAGLEQYRGMTLINSSCWQAQTSYQKMHGFKPIPGRVPLYDLHTGGARMLNFHTGSAGVDRTGRSNLARDPDPTVAPGDVV